MHYDDGIAVHAYDVTIRCIPSHCSTCVVDSSLLYSDLNIDWFEHPYG